MKAIYLDNNATTPVDPQVLEKMLPYFQIHFGNAASASHQWGWAADVAVKKARQQMASLIGAKESEIYFTSGATEANNMAITGLIHQIRSEDPLASIHIISSQIEHESVKRTLEYAQKFYSIDVDFLPVNQEGVLSVRDIENAIRPDTRLISVIWIQNEIGSIQPIHDIAKLAKDKKIYFHSDATQAIGKVLLNVESTGIDLLSGSAHKFYGPKGVGFLYIRSQNPKVQIQPLIHGGSQEKDLRSGTTNVPSIVGLGAAAEICEKNLADEQLHCEKLRDILWTDLQKEIPGVHLNGSEKNRSPVNLSVVFAGHNLDKLTPFRAQLALSAGSACHSGEWTQSYVLKAMGRTEAQAAQTLRFSLGRFTTENELTEAVQIIKKALINQ